MWMPPHISISGNDKSDKLTEQATKTIPNTIISNISTNDIKVSIHNKIHEAWQNNWKSIPALNKLNNLSLN